MNTKTLRIALALATATMASACADNSIFDRPGDAAFGEANRQTMMAQVVNPEPVYEGDMATSGDHAAQAVERYRTDNVKQPDTISTTEGGPQ
ncbi:MAG: hypothetical protein R3E14_08635 [Erythrobacter sp.]